MTDSIFLPRQVRRPFCRRRATPAPRASWAAAACWLAMGLSSSPVFLPPAFAQTAAARAAAARPSGDYIIAVVNQELVTAGELEQRLTRVRENAARSNTPLPPADELRRQVLDTLIDERVQITFARDSGQRVDEAEIDRAVANVATQNQLTSAQLRDRLRTDNIDYGRFRTNLRDQILIERVREREVQSRIRINDSEIDAWLERQQREKNSAGSGAQYNIAQVLVPVSEGASAATVAQQQARAETALARIKAGDDFATVAREVSEDSNKLQGGEIGLRAADKLPDVFVEQVRNLQPGQAAPSLLRTGAGFHILKLIDRLDTSASMVTQTHARHILLRLSAQLSQDAAQRRLAEFKQQILAGTKRFDQLARQHSEDASAAQGGDLGWAAPGMFVPEFEATMAALPNGGLSEPLVSRFGVHLIQVLERRTITLDAKQQREQARNVLREQKYEEAYTEWSRELRARAYVEMREAPQ